MKVLHCKECHHEWEGWENSKCDWCGGDNYVLAEKTDFQQFLEAYRAGDFQLKKED